MASAAETANAVAAQHLATAAQHLARAAEAKLSVGGSSAGARELGEIAAQLSSAEALLRTLLLASSSSATSSSSSSQQQQQQQKTELATVAREEDAPSTSAAAAPPPPLAKTDPDAVAAARALRAARAAFVAREGGPRALREMPMARLCAPVLAEDIAADPIPHDISLAPQPSQQPQQPQSQAQSAASEDDGTSATAAAAAATEDSLGIARGSAAQQQQQQQQPQRGTSSARSSSRASTTAGRYSPRAQPRSHSHHQQQQQQQQGSQMARGLDVAMCEVRPPKRLQESLLSKALAKVAQPPARKARYHITLPPDYSQSVVVEMSEAATVLETIAEALRCYAQEKHDAVVILKDDPHAYNMYTADDSGMPETDFPAAEESRRTTDMQCLEFALVDNPDYEVPVIMKIFTGGEDFIVLPYRADITSKEILKEVCRKIRGGAPADFELQLTTLDVPFAPDVTIGELGVSELRLVRKKKRTDTDAGAEDQGHLPRNLTKIFGPTFFFTAETAREPKQYPVVRVSKKWGFKSVLTMTIDGERVAVSAPGGGDDELSFPMRRLSMLGSSSKRQKMKQPIRLTDINKVGNVAGRPNSFFIKVGMHTHEFESSRRSEILAQLTCLLQNLGKM